MPAVNWLVCFHSGAEDDGGHRGSNSGLSLRQAWLSFPAVCHAAVAILCKFRVHCEFLLASGSLSPLTGEDWPAIFTRDTFDYRPPLIISFLAVAGVIMMLPLLLAALLPRQALLAALLVLVCIGLGTAGELPLLKTLDGTGGAGGPLAGHMFGLNGFQAAWVLLVAGAVCFSGYGLNPSSGR